MYQQFLVFETDFSLEESISSIPKLHIKLLTGCRPSTSCPVSTKLNSCPVYKWTHLSQKWLQRQRVQCIQWDYGRKEGEGSIFCLYNMISIWQKLGSDTCPRTQKQSHLEVRGCGSLLARESPSVLLQGHSPVCDITQWKMAVAC